MGDRRNARSNIGALISLILGCIAVLFPNKIEEFVSVSSNGIEGKSEIRATYGGFFLGISIFTLYSQSREAFLTIGFGWLLASFVRLATIVQGTYSLKNMGGSFFEAIIGIFCTWDTIT